MKTLHRSFLKRNQTQAGSGELSPQRPSQRLMFPEITAYEPTHRDCGSVLADVVGLERT